MLFCYSWSKVYIWNVNCALATAFIFNTRKGILAKVSTFLRQKMSRPEGDSNPQPPNALIYWVIRAIHLLSHVFEYWLWRYRYFLSKVNIWNVNCARATAFIFDTRTGVLVKVSMFLRQKISRPEGDSNSQSSDSCLTYWAIRARHLLSHVFEYWLWRHRYLWSKVIIWNVYCARITSFISETLMGVLVKVSKLLRQKMSRPEGDSNPQPSDSCRML